MAGFKDLGDWADLAGLRLPVGGKTYQLPPISAELGPRLQALWSAGLAFAGGGKPAAGDMVVLDDAAEQDLYPEILGPVYVEMQADGVPWAAIKHAAMTAFVDAVVDRDTAEKFWARLGKPPRREPADHKAPKGTARRTTPDSNAGTTSRRKPAAAKAARGRRSSSTGS